MDRILQGPAHRCSGFVFPGLSTEEISAIEQAHDFRFPPDPKGLLMLALQLSKGWVKCPDGSRTTREEST